MTEVLCGERLAALSERLTQLEARQSQLEDELATSAPPVLDHDALGALISALRTGLPGSTPGERKLLLGQVIAAIEVRGRDWIRPVLQLPVVRIVGGEVGREGIEPSTLGLRVPCSTS